MMYKIMESSEINSLYIHINRHFNENSYYTTSIHINTQALTKRKRHETHTQIQIQWYILIAKNKW